MLMPSGRTQHFAFYFEFARRAKLDNVDTSEPTAFKKLTEEVKTWGTHGAFASNILMYLLFPDLFEDMGSDKHKRNFEQGLHEEADGEQDIDKALFNIRENMKRKYREDFDFYFWERQKWKEWKAKIQCGESEKGESMKADSQLNTILFGPPGTGKTYTVQRKAVEVIEPSAELSDLEIAEKFRSYRKDGRIEFVTFHPSFSYEEFVEGFRYDEAKGIPTLHGGVFKEICKRAVNPNQRREVKDGARIWKVSLGGAGDSHIFERCMENNEIAIGWLKEENLSESLTLWEDEPKLFQDQLRLLFEENYPDESKNPQSVLNFVSRMKVGDYVAVRSSKTNIRAIGVITGDYEFREDYDEYPHTRRVEWLDTEEHDIQNLNCGKELTQQAIYELERISIPKIVELLPSSKRREKPYVLIIDEINRGNISRIFGELITLLEPDKRRGVEHELSVTLPYSGEDFSVPRNLHVIGTMNTADRSIALLDVALRRRFEFEEMMPRVDVVRDVLTKKGAEPDFIKLVCRVFETLNARITALLDRDHQLGHSYFLSATSPENLHHALYKRIFPLLQEYFYNDMEQLGHVLGEYSVAEGEKQGFVRESSLRKKLGAGFDTEHLRELHRYEVDEIKGVLDRTFPAG